MFRHAGVRVSRRASWNPSAIASGSQRTSARCWKNVSAASMMRCTAMEGSPEIRLEPVALSFRRYAAEKIVAALVVLWLGWSIVFLVFYVAPKNPATLFVGKGAGPAQLERAP